MTSVYKNGLESYLRDSITEKMIELYGDDYLTYREQWNDPEFIPPKGPLHLDIDLVDSCNQRCAMCHQSYRSRTGQSLDLRLAQELIAEGVSLGMRSVNIGAASEPLLQMHGVSELLSACVRHNVIDTFLHTNGMLLDHGKSKLLLNSRLKHLCISVDAATSGTYKAQRGIDALDLVEANIADFLSLRGDAPFPQLRISFCVTPLNKSEKETFLEKWKGRVDLLEFQDYIPNQGGVADPTARLLDKCREGIKRAAVWPDGTVSACCRGTRGITFGNLNSNSLEKIWTSPQASQVRHAIAEGPLPQECRMCFR